MAQHRRSRVVRNGIFAAAAAGALILAGCSSSGGDSGSTGGSSETFSLSYGVTNSATTTPYKALAEKYMQENPNVKITLNEVPGDSYAQTLTTQLQAGNASDVFQTAPGSGQGSSIVTLADAKLIAPLDDSVAKAIPSGSESQFQVDGKTYGVALGLTYVGGILNSTTADSLKFEYPTDWDTLISDCGDLASQGKSLYVLAGSMPPNTGLMAMILSATRVYADNPNWNQDRADDKVTFADSEGWQDTLQAVIDMNKAGCFQKGVEGAGFDGITNGILQGTSVAAFVPSGAAADLKQNAPDQDFLIESVPPASGGKPFGLAGADYALSLDAKSKNADAATKFINWAASDAGQQVWADAAGSLPLGTDLSSTIFAPVADIVNNGDFVPLPNSSWPNSAVYDALGSGVQGLLTGQKTVEDVLKAMDAAWDQ
ncbi:ABC transporter substrate-binding protein [Microbacterium sp. B2969]|uniref:ABC transporter substrate-binding protein n=1 Tax=Microbacterium alkaliflavum TaxID=3248839 RepID=A0ABW7Q8H2_9MICO